MSEFSIKVDGGSSVRLPTAGKYCDRDIVVSATDDSKALLIDIIQRKTQIKELPEGISRIGDYAFYKCETLGFRTLPDSVKAVGWGAFRECSNFVLDSLPDALEYISPYAFYGCKKLALTNLPDIVYYVGSEAFNGCVSLTEITFKRKPDFISTATFTNCTNLLTINVPWAEGEVAGAPWGATNATINYNYTGG